MHAVFNTIRLVLSWYFLVFFKQLTVLQGKLTIMVTFFLKQCQLFKEYPKRRTDNY